MAVGEPPIVAGAITGAPALAVTDVITIASVLGELIPQLLCAFTVIFPDTAVQEKLTVIVVVPTPEVMVAPDGTVQLYTPAPATEAIK